MGFKIWCEALSVVGQKLLSAVARWRLTKFRKFSGVQICIGRFRKSLLGSPVEEVSTSEWWERQPKWWIKTCSNLWQMILR